MKRLREYSATQGEKPRSEVEQNSRAIVTLQNWRGTKSLPVSRRHLLRISTLLRRRETSVTLSGWFEFQTIVEASEIHKENQTDSCVEGDAHTRRRKLCIESESARAKVIAQSTSFADVEESRSPVSSQSSRSISTSSAFHR